MSGLLCLVDLTRQLSLSSCSGVPNLPFLGVSDSQECFSPYLCAQGAFWAFCVCAFVLTYIVAGMALFGHVVSKDLCIKCQYLDIYCLSGRGPCRFTFDVGSPLSFVCNLKDVYH